MLTKILISLFILLLVCFLSIENYDDYQNSCYSQYLRDTKYPDTNPFYCKGRQWRYQGFPMNL